MPEWFQQGGFVMWPLLLCSVAGLAIIIERCWVLRRQHIIPARVAGALAKRGTDKETTDKLKSIVEHDKSVLGELTRVAFDHATLHKTENIEAVQAVARQAVGRMERGLTTLGLIAELGPLLGLLGTVNGMLHLFADVANLGMSDPKLISAGISEALVATFTGLFISIPALIAYMYLRRRIETLVLEMERHVDELLTRLYP
ncbi:MAG: Protein TolQ [Verrucomicrobiae bacterium]|nr:Protein TolQ [Verrucomicrobiae bacterium]